MTKDNITNICLQEIQFTEDGEFTEVQLMRVGKFMHPFMEDFEVTEEMFKSFKKNFDAGVKKVDLAVDYSHFSGEKAAGWITAVTLKENNTQLWITVSWTESARAAIKDKEFRYMSADFNTKYIDNETGKDFGATLNGAGLTNRPFIKDMQSVLSDVDISQEKRNAILAILNEEPEEKEIKEMNAEELKAEVAKLSDAEKQEMGLIETVEVKLSDDESKEALAKSEEENKKLSDELETEKKDRQFSDMLKEGKAVEAQRDAFMSGDMAGFVKLSVSVNVEATGSGAEQESDSKIKTFDEASDKVAELADAMVAKDSSLTYSEANKTVLSAHPELEKILETGE